MIDLDSLKTWLFVPALQEKYVRSAVASRAQAFILDLEDSVPIERKADARGLLLPMASGLRVTGRPVFIRVNKGVDADLVAASAIPIAGIIVPKIETAEEMDRAKEVFVAAGGSDSTLFIAAVESALGVLNSREIAASTATAGIMFGTGDFVAETGFAITPEALMTPAAMLALAAKAHGKPVFGLAASIAELDDLDALAKWSQHARALGYSGTPLIHPKQVDVVTAAFSPTEVEVERAHRTIEAFERSAGGAAAVDGRLIERPVYVQALSVVRRALDRIPA